MDQAECRTADWRAIGYEDGSQGRRATALGERRRNCAGHGVTPDFAAYMDGHGQGIAEFCRPQNGYRLGTSGYRYGGMCPAGLEDAFLAAHADGFGLYQRRATVKRLSKLIARKRNRSKTIEHLMARKTAALVSPATLPSQRFTIGIELKQLTEERVEIERLIGQLETDLAQARQDYRVYHESLAHR
jgi:hypothetical protein